MLSTYGSRRGSLFTPAGLLILTFFIWSGGHAAPENTGTISGYVTDRRTGEFLIGANVLVAGTLTGATTNTSGFYSIPNAPAGTLRLRISFIGYATRFMSVIVHPGASVRLDAGIDTEELQYEEVVTEGRRGDGREDQVQTGLVNVQALQVERLPRIGETDLFRALKLVPGVKASSELSAGLYIRGGSPDQNLILLDGNTVYNPNHLFGFFSTFNMDAVKDIQLIKGGFGAEHGGKMSAVVDVTNKDGNRKEFHGSGGVSLIASRLTLETPLDNFGSLMLSGRRTYIDLLLSSMEKQTKDPLPDYHFFDLTGKLNLDLGSRDKLTLSAYFGQDDLGLNLFKERPDRMGLDWGNQTYSIRYGRIISDQLYSRLIVSGSRYSATAEQDIEGANAVFTEMIRDYTVKNDWDYFLSEDHFLRGGLFFTTYRFEVTSDFNSSFVTKFKSSPRYMGGYLQDNWRVTDLFTLQFGLRYNYFSAGDHVRVEPRISGTYHLTDRVAVKAAWGIYHQYTNLLSLGAMEFLDIWTPVTENLPPGKATQSVLGVDFPIGDDLTVGVEGYYKDLQNVVETKPNGELDLDTLANSFYSGTGRAFGIEIFVQKKVGAFTGWLGYTLSRTERTIPELNNGRPFPPKYDRLHDLSVVLTWQMAPDWRVGSSFVYATGQAYTSPDYRYALGTPDLGGMYVVAAERNNYRLEPYHRLDVSATHDFEWMGMQCDLTLSVSNVYNHRNVLFREFNVKDAGRPAEITDVRLLPILPTLELNFRF